MRRHRHVGKHRALPRRLPFTKRLGTCAVLVGSCGLGAAAWPAAVSADAPVRTGWWNQASSGSQAAPEPTTPVGGLHVAVASNQIGAFGAVLYPLPAGARATLTLDVAHLAATPVVNPTSPSTTPQMEVQACPTKDVAWKAGDDQPWAAAPAYDCTHAVPGALAHDQKSVAFVVDGSMDTSPGQLSLAIVPILTNEIPGAGTEAPLGTTQPYSLDTAKPNATSLVATGGGMPRTPKTNPSGTNATSPATSTGTMATGTMAAKGPVDATGAGAAVPPPIPGTDATAPDAGTAPVVAPPTAANPVVSAAPAANTAHKRRNAALAMLLLIALGLAAMNRGQLQRPPRLLGGSARRQTAAQPAPAGVTIYGTRGLGRFNRPRTRAPHPLV